MYAQALGNTFWQWVGLGVVGWVRGQRLRLRLDPESSLDKIPFHACLSIFALSLRYIVEGALSHFSYLCFFLPYIRESSTAACRRVGRVQSLRMLGLVALVSVRSYFYLSNIF